MLISSNIPNLVNGVSQQPSALRLPSQCEELINGLPTVAKGLRKRPPTKHLANLYYTKKDGSAIQNPLLVSTHLINRSATERFFAEVRDGQVRVFGLDGAEQNVVMAPGSAAYLAGAAHINVKFLTVNDYTFVVNTGKAVQATQETSLQRPYEALVWVKAGNYGKTYVINIDGVDVASHTTPDGSELAHAALVSTEHIATELAADLSGSLGGTSAITLGSVTHFTRKKYQVQHVFNGESWNFENVAIDVYAGATFTFPAGATSLDSTVFVDGNPAPVTAVGNGVFQVAYADSSTPRGINATKFDAGVAAKYGVQRIGAKLYISSATPFTIRTEDGFGGNNMTVFKDAVQRFSDLPPDAGIDGFTLEVRGEANDGFSGYWVMYETQGTSGTWKETIQPGVAVGIDPATMPHALTNNGNGTFSFGPVAWGKRLVGDLDSSPPPSFVGRPINDVFFFRNRLGFLSDEFLCLSEAGVYFNFFATTVTTLLDSDPIDTSVSHTSVSILKHAIPVGDTLLLFADNAQFTVEPGEILTQKTIAIKVATTFQMDPVYRPVTIGRNTYFVMPKGDYNTVREFFVDSQSNTKDAADITAHVPQYITRPNGTAPPFGLLRAATGDDTLFLSTHSTAGGYRTLWVYRFYWSGNEKLQSAWSKWEFDPAAGICGMEVIDSDLYLLLWRADKAVMTLEKLSLSLGDIGEDEPYNVHLDEKRRFVPQSNGYDPERNRTFISALWQGVNQEELTAVTCASASDVQPGVRPGEIMPVFVEGGSSYVRGNYAGCPLIIGRDYTFRFDLSTQYLRGNDGQVSKAELGGRLQMRRMALNYSDTGYFKTIVYNVGRDPVENVYSGHTLSDLSSTLGQTNIAEGRFAFPIMGRNTTTRVSVVSDLPLPVSLLTADWEGFFVKRSRST